MNHSLGIFRRGKRSPLMNAVLATMEEIRRPRAICDIAGGVGEFEFGTVPGFGSLANYSVVRADAVEAVRQPLYDRLLYPTAGQTQLRFFQNPQGQGSTTASGAAAGSPKTLDDTNMESAGMLPSPKAFLATSIEVIFDPGSVSTANTFTLNPVVSAVNAASVTNISQIPALNAMNDINAVMITGWLDFFIIAKSYVQLARLDSFPPKRHVAYDASVSIAGEIAIAGLAQGRAVGQPFYLNPPCLLMPNTNFNVSLNWPVAIATPSGLNGRISIRLDGYLYRNAQ